MGHYDDLIYQAPPVSDRRSRMKMEDRAKQFAPFAALKGYEAAIKAKEREYSPRLLLSETRKSELNDQLQQLYPGQMITVRHYQEHSYAITSGIFSAIDPVRKRLILSDLSIAIYDISDILIG